ncbi:MAG TPA: S41 family peptidase [Thermoleophilia bacterium]|nr:S41 family peptidase [Thermoleophilia bacterium]
MRGQAGLYRQILSDLQRDYYRPVDVARLGSSGIAALLAPLHDPYTVYFSPRQAKQFADQLSGTYSGIGTGVALQHGRLAVTEVFPGSPAAAAHIVPGEVIVSVDGVATAGHSLTADVARIAGPAGSRVSLKLQRPGHSGLIALVLTRRTISVPLTTSRLIVDRGTKVGYVHLSSFASGAGDQVERAVAGLRRRGARWIILDLRDNGGGLVSEAARVSGDFLPGGKTVVTMQGLHSPRQVVSATGGPATRLPLVVLVNGNTASASEIVTGALQDYRRATVIGTRTFGKGVVQDTLPLSGGAELKITVASYRTPLGRDLNHKGIEPSIVVPARPGARADAALARALRFIATGR